MVDEGSWRAELDRWLEPCLAELNHAARRSMCPHYIAGLIGLGERKSMQPMAARQDGLSLSYSPVGERRVQQAGYFILGMRVRSARSAVG